MGILTQALAGGVAEGASTAANLMSQDINMRTAASLQSERDKANAVREQSLAEFRQGLVEKTDIARENRALENTIDPDVRTEDGGLITKGDAVKKLKAGEQLYSSKETTAESNAQAKIDAATMKNESALAIAQMKTENALKIADMRYEQAKEIAAMKIKGNDTSAIKEATLELKKAEEQRKNAQAAAKLLNDTGGDMTEEQTKIYNKLMKGAGEDDAIKPLPTKEEPKAEKKGIVGTTIDAVKGLFSKDEESGNADPKREELSTQLSAAVEKINKSNLSPAEKQRRIDIAVRRANSIK